MLPSYVAVDTADQRASGPLCDGCHEPSHHQPPISGAVALCCLAAGVFDHSLDKVSENATKYYASIVTYFARSHATHLEALALIDAAPGVPGPYNTVRTTGVHVSSLRDAMDWFPTWSGLQARDWPAAVALVAWCVFPDDCYVSPRAVLDGSYTFYGRSYGEWIDLFRAEMRRHGCDPDWSVAIQASFVHAATLQCVEKIGDADGSHGLYEASDFLRKTWLRCEGAMVVPCGNIVCATSGARYDSSYSREVSQASFAIAVGLDLAKWLTTVGLGCTTDTVNRDSPSHRSDAINKRAPLWLWLADCSSLPLPLRMPLLCYIRSNAVTPLTMERYRERKAGRARPPRQAVHDFGSVLAALKLGAVSGSPSSVHAQPQHRRALTVFLRSTCSTHLARLPLYLKLRLTLRDRQRLLSAEQWLGHRSLLAGAFRCPAFDQRGSVRRHLGAAYEDAFCDSILDGEIAATPAAVLHMIAGKPEVRDPISVGSLGDG